MNFFNEPSLKQDFKKHFNNILDVNKELKILLYEIFVYGSAYVVGGYLRDFIDKKPSRDIDILIDLKNETLINIIDESGIEYSINRHEGIKLHLDNLEVDMWSIENNWAFKKRLVKLNEKDKLSSIAKGCFYNFDSLVINLHNYNYHISNYNRFTKENTLDILQKSPEYKLLNPTTNANILRAFYLKKKFECKYSSNTKEYLLKKIGELKDSREDILTELVHVLKKYPKYKNMLSKEDLSLSINELYEDNNLNKQFYLKF